MHTIHNIAFEVDVNYNNPLVSWEQYYVDFFQERLLPRVERMCDDWDQKHPNSKCVIDTLAIDVEVRNVDLETLQKEVLQQISQQLHSISSDGTNSDGKIVATITKQASPFEALVGYLSEGILPAHISVKAFKEWLGAVAEFTSVEKTKLNALFLVKTEAIARMLSLLRNDYEKLSNIISNKQQITSQFIKVENAFFQQLLKVMCTQFKLSYKPEEAEIWYQTLGVSSSLPQFSKTLLQLFQPKAVAAGKRLTRVDETQLTVLVVQAIAQYETNNSIAIDASKIATIVTDDHTKAQKSDPKTGQKSTKKSSENDVAQQRTQKIEKQAETQSKSNSENSRKGPKVTDKTNPEKAAQKKFQTATNRNNEATHHLSKQSEKTGNTTTDALKKTFGKEAESHLAKADKTNEEIAIPRIRKNMTTAIEVTTEKAGLILLHPFLSRFFNGVGLLNEDKEFKDIGKACMLLHYLATETEEVTDVELTLEKILLGIPPETIINYQTPLTENEIKLCKELLNAVLEHWQVLKKSTINTLRDLFIKRDGQILLTEDSIKLKIERAAQDVLLEKIPWNISLFRLKWMDKMMHIEW
ncbi:hypothetical protein KORDIASMS9_03780 [Kordia sp. SMS9]|uniref:contractile injection system tape measure protein n=1 Tax=Kordia sp. SMS9 TaxID=2282170 RepID=UPI000E0D3FC6|nr:contractile injection system tape measure protein [Kordia sp. SMS9]AXG71523.1 hypothetical protein KORDIASMS9_03780 [Kordia sp. SMS9]